jgi:hypothetical protein
VLPLVWPYRWGERGSTGTPSDSIREDLARAERRHTRHGLVTDLGGWDTAAVLYRGSDLGL